MKRIFKNRYFTASFFISLILIFLAAGMVAVDYSGRSITFDDRTPVMQIEETGDKTYLEVNLFGVDQSFDISPVADAAEVFADFICFPQS